MPAAGVGVGWVTFGVSLAVYVAWLCPSPYWLDSSELAAAAFTLGVAHPPGHPLAALVGKLVTLVPLGSVALRVGLASALAGAAAAAAVARLGVAVVRRVGEALAQLSAEGGDEARGGSKLDDKHEAAIAAAAALGWACGYGAAFQAVRPEVYALHAALVLWATVFLVEYDARGERRHLYAAALLVGLALANHHLLAFAFAAPALLFVLVRPWPPGPLRAAGWSIAAAALGLAAYAYLPLRALTHPLVNWGAPSTVARFIWTVSAQAFQKSVGGFRADDPWALPAVIALELGVLAPAALLGVYALVRLRGLGRLALLLVGVVLCDALARALVGFDPQNPDAHGYLEPVLALSSVLAAAGLSLMVGVLRAGRPGRSWTAPGRRVATGLISVTLVAAPLASVALTPDSRLTTFADADRVAGALLDEAPSRAAVFTSYFQTVFGLWYLRGVEGRRPDVEHLHRHFLAYPGYRAEALARWPEAISLVDERDLRWPALARFAQKTPTLLEYDLDVPVDVATRLRAGVVIDHLEPVALGDAAQGAAERSAVAERARLVDRLRLDEPQTRRALLWLEFLSAERVCAVGPGDAGRAHMERARALLGGIEGPELHALAARCGIHGGR